MNGRRKILFSFIINNVSEQWNLIDLISSKKEETRITGSRITCEEANIFFIGDREQTDLERKLCVLFEVMERVS